VEALQMMKYLIGLGILVAAVIAYVVLAPSSAPVPAPTATAPAATQPATLDEDARLEQIAAANREVLPATVTDTLTQTYALFLPRMRIMEHSYVTTAPDPRATASALRAMIAERAGDICRDGREMFTMGVTLRNSFEDRAGNLIQRVYLLPEDCQRFN
jgi:hypothetical protein